MVEPKQCPHRSSLARAVGTKQTKDFAFFNFKREVADDGFVISPTIAPVVDLSNVNSAASSMNSMFGTANIGATFSPVSMSQAKRYSDISFNTNSADVVDRMQDISAQLDILGDRIANMQIVLDSGELVGATSSRIDNSLGRIAVPAQWDVKAKLMTRLV